MLTIFVFTFLLQVFFIFLSQRDTRSIRDSFVRSIVVLGGFIWFSTEILSRFSLLNTFAVSVWWGVCNLCLFLFLIYTRNSADDTLQRVRANFHELKKEYSSYQLSPALLIMVVSIFAIVLILALIFPPNTVDVMTYHLPRVAHWIQAGNIEFYPTNIDRQLFNAPFTEYSLLHLQLLAGSDHFANLVQFSAFVAVTVISSLIAKRFSLNSFGQILTAFITAMIPMAILQASSAKNDLVVSLFTCSFFYFYLSAAEENSPANFFFAGLSLGLAVLTKGNANFYCLPIGLLIFSVYFFYQKSARNKYRFAAQTFLVLLIALSINSTHYYRNWQVFGNPLQAENRLKTEKITASTVYGNAVRNYFVHLGTYFETATEMTESAVESILGSEFNNPASTLDKQRFTVFKSLDEESAGNFFHLILLSIGIIYIFIYSRKSESKAELILAISIIAGFLLVCTFLKWNLWISRIHLPLFCLGSPLIALFLSKAKERFVQIIFILLLLDVIAIFAIGTPRNFFIFSDNTERNSRNDFYFIREKSLGPIYSEAAEFIRNQNPEEVGLYISVDQNQFVMSDWEYPLWILLKDDFAQKPILNHYGVVNPSNKFNQNKTPPEWIFSTGKATIIDNVSYEVVWEKTPVRILRKIDSNNTAPK